MKLLPFFITTGKGNTPVFDILITGKTSKLFFFQMNKNMLDI